MCKNQPMRKIECAKENNLCLLTARQFSYLKKKPEDPICLVGSTWLFGCWLSTNRAKATCGGDVSLNRLIIGPDLSQCYSTLASGCVRLTTSASCTAKSDLSAFRRFCRLSAKFTPYLETGTFWIFPDWKQDTARSLLHPHHLHWHSGHS